MTSESYNYQVFLKLGCISNLDMLVMGFISLVLMKLNYAKAAIISTFALWSTFFSNRVYGNHHLLSNCLEFITGDLSEPSLLVPTWLSGKCGVAKDNGFPQGYAPFHVRIPGSSLTLFHSVGMYEAGSIPGDFMHQFAITGDCVSLAKPFQ